MRQAQNSGDLSRRDGNSVERRTCRKQFPSLRMQCARFGGDFEINVGRCCFVVVLIVMMLMSRKHETETKDGAGQSWRVKWLEVAGRAWAPAWPLGAIYTVFKR